MFFTDTRSRGDKDRLSGHSERRRGGEADDRGIRERDEGPFNQRHLHARRPARQTAGRHPGGLTLQVSVQEEKEVQASVVPQKEQEAEREGRDLRRSELCGRTSVKYYSEIFPSV